MNWLKSIFHNPPKALFQAISDSLNDEAVGLLTTSPALAHCSRNTHWLNGATPLHCCASAGNVVIAEKLLAMGVNVDTRTVYGETPLHVAVSSGQSVFVQLLLDKGADVRVATSRGQTSIHTATEQGDFQILTTLLNYGFDCANLTDKKGWTPLHIAAQKGKTDCIELLIRHGGNVDAASADEKTPLHVAVANDNPDCVEMLVRHGANINAAAVKMVTPLHVAVTNGLESMVALLLKLGADRDLCLEFDGYHFTASALASLLQAKNGSVVYERIISLFHEPRFELTSERREQIRADFAAMTAAIDDKLYNTMIYPGEDAAYKLARRQAELSTARTAALCLKYGVTESVLQDVIKHAR